MDWEISIEWCAEMLNYICALCNEGLIINNEYKGEWEKVYVSTYFIPNLKRQYTAITRAQNELLLY